MKKKNIFKFTLTLILAFAMSGASAQILTNYVQAVGAESVDTVITGTTTRLYVYPDLIYSPTYDAATNANLGVNQRWEWYPSTDGSGVPIKASANENWIQYSWGAVATYPVSVIESNSLSSCTGSVSTINVEILASPTVAFTAADGDPVLGSGGAPFTFCEGDARIDGTEYVQAAFTSSIAGSPSYQIQYTLTVDTTHSGGATWTTIAAMTQTYSGAAGTQQAVTGTTHDLTLPAGGFVVVNDGGTDYPTRYTYSLNGVTDRITRKCDYIGNSGALATGWTWYDTASPETLSIIVNPVPVTGPIYHISNMWAN